MQKRIVRIMMGCRKEVSCRNLFRNLKIQPLISQYILSLTLFIIKNKSQFTVNSEIHNINTRQHTNLHQPTSNLTGYQQGIYHSAVRVYNNLPSHIKQLSDDHKNFELKLKKCLYLHSFYSLEEYFQY
jgi:spore maturation protein CgeB